MMHSPFQRPSFKQRFYDRLQTKPKLNLTDDGLLDVYFIVTLPNFMAIFQLEFDIAHKALISVVRQSRFHGPVDGTQIAGPITVSNRLLIAWARLMEPIYNQYRLEYDHHRLHHSVAADLEYLNARRLRHEVSVMRGIPAVAIDIGRSVKTKMAHLAGGPSGSDSQEQLDTPGDTGTGEIGTVTTD
ncbi:uncharacterized protein K460DRAFT_418578 [Cucurbitaria berberidis CBS 394.84]|uniref:Uncharacterized protein n=1 Tax=Cucurbitaria berberidis CBS 394.84 TaxID=1168544 RepID=A0A9P4L686_9PLEO|nr:uncharacterized protein K460DRAFT_418578 [Cucurbitaria berberidis CBS 394.84]KAF1843530.1 hypothetical protein K460DRAFT_418578 [Cucurbitaria berberidis CBS 394.84]